MLSDPHCAESLNSFPPEEACHVYLILENIFYPLNIPAVWQPLEEASSWINSVHRRPESSQNKTVFSKKVEI